MSLTRSILAIALVAGLLFGVGPAVQCGRAHLQHALRTGSQHHSMDRGGHRLRRLLIAGEFALALMLMMGAGLLMRSIAGLQRVNPGFEPANVLTANISLPTPKYREPASQIAFADELCRRLAAMPGIQAAGIATILPFRGFRLISRAGNDNLPLFPTRHSTGDS